MNPHSFYTHSCLICNDSDTLLTTTKPEIKIPDQSVKKNPVVNDLQVIFVLRNILEIPTEQLGNYLVKWGSPCSGEWIKICSVCWHAVENAMRIYQEIVESTVIFRRVKNEIIRKIKRTTKTSTPIKVNETVKEIADNSREFVLNHDYGPSEDPFIFGDLMASQKLSKVDDFDADPVDHQSQFQHEIEKEPDDEFTENYDDTSHPDSPIDFEEEQILIKKELTDHHNSSLPSGVYHSDSDDNLEEPEEAPDPELEPVTTDNNYEDGPHSEFSGNRALYHHVRDNHANAIISDPEMQEPNDIEIDYEEDALSNHLSLTATPTPSSTLKAIVKTPPKIQKASHLKFDKFKPHKLVNFIRKVPTTGRLPLSIYTCSCGCQFHGKGKNPSDTFNRHLKEMKIYPKEIPKCQFCERTFRNKNNLRNHMETHGAEPVECQSCGKTLKGKYGLMHHMRKNCRKAVISSSQNRYKKMEEQQSSTLAKIPKKSDENLTHQLAKIFNKNGPKRNYDYLCKCGNKFLGQNAMYRFNRHVNQKNMKPEEMFKCEICGTCFNRFDSLKYHVERHIKNTVKCGPKKERKMGRNILVISQEEGEDNHSDSNLDQTAANPKVEVEEPNDIELDYKNDQLSNHINVTAPPTPAEIPVKTPPPPPKKTCSPRKRKSVKAEESKVHKLAEFSKEKGPNGEEKPIYLCICGIKFAKKHAYVSFSRHLTLMNLKPKEMQKCKICGRRFRRAYDLRIHMQSHSVEPVNCEFCGKTFKGKRVLYVHIRDSCKKARKSKGDKIVTKSV